MSSARERSEFVKKYTDLIEEMHGCFSTLIFPEMPACDRRVELMSLLLGTNVSEALYILAHLHRALRLAGAVCEFGVAQGATSALLANEIRATDKDLWLFDSFQGLPRPTEKDLLINDIFNLGSMDKYAGTMSCQAGEVKSRLRNIDFPPSRIRIIPGFIEETVCLPGLPSQVCFAYVDFDLYNPIGVALKFLHERLSTGGYIIVDDYGCFSQGAKTAVDEFMVEHGDDYRLTLPYAFSGHFAILQKTC